MHPSESQIKSAQEKMKGLLDEHCYYGKVGMHLILKNKRVELLLLHLACLFPPAFTFYSLRQGVAGYMVTTNSQSTFSRFSMLEGLRLAPSSLQVKNLK